MVSNRKNDEQQVSASPEGDSLKTARRRDHEKEAISHMIAIYCEARHPEARKEHRAHCGKLVCAECGKLDAFNIARVQRCPKMVEGGHCFKCEHPCYGPDMKQKLGEIMRVSGPKMLVRHPALSLMHVSGR